MTDKSRKILMILVGAYLVYSGVTLVRDVLIEAPSNKMLLAGFGVLFVLFGVFAVVWNVKEFIKERKKAQEEMALVDDEEAQGEEEADFEK